MCHQNIAENKTHSDYKTPKQPEKWKENKFVKEIFAYRDLVLFCSLGQKSSSLILYVFQSSNA